MTTEREPLEFMAQVDALILKYLPPEEFPGLRDAYGLKVRVFAANLLSAHNEAIERAVAEEKERCAKIADEFPGYGGLCHQAGKDIAAAIRLRRAQP